MRKHLAIVYGEGIRSASLEEYRPGDEVDQERERVLRGARPLAEVKRMLELEGVNGSLRCDCAEQLQEAMRLMSVEREGVILYLKQEGRGIGLREKLRLVFGDQEVHAEFIPYETMQNRRSPHVAYNLIDLGHDTMAANVLLGHPPDARSYEIASAILHDLGISRSLNVYP
ncbi:GTP cyclohydrolase II [Borealophlyctis nickersoniae]|nr:GTP cyclohydrolase II [Borealophlyctis nickersoniae]